MSNVRKIYEKHLAKEEDYNILYKKYVELSTSEIDEIIDIAIQDEETDLNKKANIFLHLALFSYGCGEKLPKKLYDYLLRNNTFYYSEMYLRADEDTAIKIVDKINNMPVEETLSLNHALMALSFIRCETSKNFLHDSGLEPFPQWVKSLHISPVLYAYGAGWNISGSNDEKLFSDKVIPLRVIAKKANDKNHPIYSLDETCHFCGSKLAVMLETEIKFTTCFHCSCHQTIFTCTSLGNVWLNANQKSDILSTILTDYKTVAEDTNETIVNLSKKTFVPLEEERRATYSAHEFAMISRTQQGGMPTHINDMDYPICPRCGKVMKFVGQVDMGDLEECGEGLYYFFTCENCKINGCNYAQS